MRLLRRSVPHFKINNINLHVKIKVMEIRPSIEWDKGNALEYLLETLGLSNPNDVLPLYIGDDRTDEDAFKVRRRIHKNFQ